jgi:hypothetical protein
VNSEKKRKNQSVEANTLGIVFPSSTACRSKQETAMSLSDVLSRFDSGELIGLIALTGGLVVGLILGMMGILLGFYVERVKSRRAEILASLKQDMLNRGMPADEICMVLEAGTKSTRKHHDSAAPLPVG